MYPSGSRYLFFSYCLKLLNEQRSFKTAINNWKWTWRKTPEDFTFYWHGHGNFYTCHSSYPSETQCTVTNGISESEWNLLLHWALLFCISIRNLWDFMLSLRFLYTDSTRLPISMALRTKRRLFSYQDMFQNALIIWVVTLRQNYLY